MPLLLTLEADDWTLEISGPVRALPSHLPTAQTSVEVETDAPVTLRVYDPSRRQLEHVEPGAPLAPVFFENTGYDFYFTSADAVLHLPPAADLRHRKGSLAHHALNFRNDVGYAGLRVESAAAPAAARIEVFPSKLDYRSDYVRLRDAVAGITRGLVLGVQARTFGHAAPVSARRPTLVEWRSLLEDFFMDLMAAGQSITRQPHSTLIATHREVPPERARRVDERALDRRMRRRPRRPGGRHPITGALLPARVPETNRRRTYDTPVNRYVKAVLRETTRKLRRVIRTEVTGDEDADRNAEQKFFEAFRPSARQMLRQVRGLLREPFLAEAAATAPARPASLVLTRHPHYAALDRAAQKLNGGLDAGGGALRVGHKNIAQLYEYWCFLRLVELLREHFELVQQDVVQVGQTDFAVTLEKDRESTIRFRDPASGRVLTLRYDRRFDALPTTAQRPDNVVQLASEKELYLFDAKYRLSYGPGYRKRYGSAGPRTGDINTMHRYRDAIVISQPRERVHERIVRGAVVLFPYAEEEAYREHRFFQSIGKVEVGGLPFLPESDTLVTEKLREILRSSGFGG